MKTATVREVQHNLRALLAWVAEGETVTVTRNRRVVAQMVPPAKSPAIQLPDFVGRLKRTFPRGVKGKPLSQVIDDQRGPRS